MEIILYNRDCLGDLGIKCLEPKSIDMVLCDPPFGLTKNQWDVVLPPANLWRDYDHACKVNAAICLFGNQPFTSDMILSNRTYFRYSLVWEKNKFSDFLNAKRKPMKIHEDIILFYKKQPTYNPQYTRGKPYTRWNTQAAVDTQTNYGRHKENFVDNTEGTRLPVSVLKFSRVERPLHPTQKPIDLCEWLIRTYTNEGEWVLDNCIGSGTTAIACINTNRNCVGYESNAEYFATCKERIEKHIRKFRVERQEGDDYIKWKITP